MEVVRMKYSQDKKERGSPRVASAGNAPAASLLVAAASISVKSGAFSVQLLIYVHKTTA